MSNSTTTTTASRQRTAQEQTDWLTCQKLNWLAEMLTYDEYQELCEAQPGWCDEIEDVDLERALLSTDPDVREALVNWWNAEVSKEPFNWTYPNISRKLRKMLASD